MKFFLNKNNNKKYQSYKLDYKDDINLSKINNFITEIDIILQDDVEKIKNSSNKLYLFEYLKHLIIKKKLLSLLEKQINKNYLKYKLLEDKLEILDKLDQELKNRKKYAKVESFIILMLIIFLILLFFI